MKFKTNREKKFKLSVQTFDRSHILKNDSTLHYFSWTDLGTKRVSILRWVEMVKRSFNVFFHGWHLFRLVWSIWEAAKGFNIQLMKRNHLKIYDPQGSKSCWILLIQKKFFFTIHDAAMLSTDYFYCCCKHFAIINFVWVKFFLHAAKISPLFLTVQMNFPNYS